MKPWLDDGDVRLYHGDCLEVLAQLPERSVDCCVTSPPYWGLRDYGTGRWEGGNPEHEHDTAPARGGRGGSGAPGKQTDGAFPSELAVDTCSCGATRVDRQLGLEQTPQEYVARMIDVFRQVRRVLKDEGTVWLNLGDSYATTPTGNRGEQYQDTLDRYRAPILDGLKPKDLVGIPWRVAFALQDDGWYLRSDIIWAKPNPMPESVTDRPTKAHEYVFLLSKQPQYFWDQEAIRETYTPDGRKTTTVRSGNGAIGLRGASDRERWAHSGRNVRSVWEIATQPFPGAHFAVFPMELARRCVLAGTSEKGCCPECGKPWQRDVEQTGEWKAQHERVGKHDGEVYRRNPGGGLKGPNTTTERVVKGWKPSCDCINTAPDGACDATGRPWTAPAVVLDPFSGSGTTALVARNHQRHAIGIELNEDYLRLAADRLAQQSLLTGGAA